MAAQPDKKTVIKDLLELGKSKGQLSTKEILDALGELDFDPEQIEKFYDTLESQGVEIVEDFDDITIDDEELAKAAANVSTGYKFLPFEVYARGKFGDYAGDAYTGKTTLSDAVASWQKDLQDYAKQQGYQVK